MYKIHARNFHLRNPSTVNHIKRTVDAQNPDKISLAKKNPISHSEVDERTGDEC